MDARCCFVLFLKCSRSLAPPPLVHCFLAITAINQVRTLLRQRVGLVQRLRTAARPAKRRPTLSGANDLEQEQNHDDYEDEAILLKATATRLLEQLHQWLHSSKLRLLDVFRSHAKHARSDGDHKGGSEDRDSGGGGQDDDVLDEDEAIALFAGAQSVMQFENVTEDDARALVSQRVCIFFTKRLGFLTAYVRAVFMRP